MDQTIASLLILSGDESPELVKTFKDVFVEIITRVKKGTEFRVSEATERDLEEIELLYDLNLHQTWHTRLPQDLLVVSYHSLF